MSSGDPRLDRRYAYARAALDEGDAAGAAEILEQTLEEAPGWAEAWHLLALAREALGQAEAAIEAYRAAAAHDADGVLGAGVDLARLGARDPVCAAQPAYVARLFDDYAPRFDRHLRISLGYRAPELLFEAVMRAAGQRARALHFARALDLGCGTGLAGEAFRDRCGWLSGVDLSAKMIAAARRKRVYDMLRVGGLEAALADEDAGSLDLILAADVFVYLGELAPAFAAAGRALGRDGLFAFTVQTPAEGDLVVGPDKRFAHSRPYILRTLEATGLRPLLVEAATPRTEAGAPVEGLVIVAAHA